MKRFFAICAFGLFGMVLLFGKELNGKDLQAVHWVLDAKYYVDNYEKSEEKLAFLTQKEMEFRENYGDVSEEALIICKSIFILAKETAKISAFYNLDESMGQANKKEKKDKAEKKERAAESEMVVMNCFKELKAFAENNSEMSACFNYHYKEVEFSTLPYLSTNEQLGILKNVIEDYRKIEEQNPKLSENLFMLGTVLYFVPKIAGGDKKEAKEKLILALENAGCLYEKNSALVMLSQIHFEDKEFDEAKKYLDEARKMNLKNKSVELIARANEAGYSMFRMENYLKKQGGVNKS
ncbi:MAG: hypothetical protein MJ188_06630 [Treponema sp.]|nr:hypothetical protein [Treponema sp.]